MSSSGRRPSATQPLPSKSGNATGKEDEGANNSIEGNLSYRPCKNPRSVLGMAASGGSNTCKKVRKKMSYDRAIVKTKATVESEKKIQKLGETKIGKENFAQAMCLSFKEERDALKKDNSML